MHEEMREPTEEELRAAFEEQMRQIRVEDVILQTVATLVNLAGRRLGLAGDGGEGRRAGASWRSTPPGRSCRCAPRSSRRRSSRP